jgi:hypothetical protein
LYSDDLKEKLTRSSSVEPSNTKAIKKLKIGKESTYTEQDPHLVFYH